MTAISGARPELLTVIFATITSACTHHPLYVARAADGGNGHSEVGGDLAQMDGLAAVDVVLTGTAGTGGTPGFGNTGGSGAAAGSTGGGGVSFSGGTTGSGGVSIIGGATGSGGMPFTGGATGTSDSTCPVVADVISDFESDPGKATMNRQAGRTGYWSVHFYGWPMPAAGMVQTPAPSEGSAIATEIAPDVRACNQFGLHSTGSRLYEDVESPVGFGAFFQPRAPYDGTGYGYDVSAYTGISFKIRSGSGTPPAVFFEVVTKGSLSAAEGGNASDPGADLYNTRGQLLNAPWSPTDISTTYQMYTVPFGTLAPHWLPSPDGSPIRSHTDRYCRPGADYAKCQAKPFNAKEVLGIRVAMYTDSGFPKPTGSTLGTYDLWIDDVAFVKNDAGLPMREGFPLKSPGGFGSCIHPRGPSAAAKFLVPAYNQWKARFVKNNKVIRPDNKDDTLSEGIAFGMLIAVNMNDQPLFDGLYATWNGNPATDASTLMKSCLTGGGSTGISCSPSDGSITGADQDAAYALLMADKLWGGSYKADAVAMLKDIWAKDIDSTNTKLPKGGSKYEAPTGTQAGQVTSASYFAPSFYRTFASADTDASHDWAGVIAAVYQVISGPIVGKDGLIPAWCGNRCTAAASNGAENDGVYQYDAHRIPMRIGLDYCFFGTAEAKIYTDLTTHFFGVSARDGVGFVADMYEQTGMVAAGTSQTVAARNSASMLGTAGVGAMASGKEPAFLDDAYQAVFDALTRGTMAPPPVDDGHICGGPYGCPPGEPVYSYYNATVGMLTLLIMTGNFLH